MEINEGKVKIHLLKPSGVFEIAYFEYHLLMVLSNSVRVRVENNNYYLHEKDVLLFVPGDHATYFCGEQCLMIDIEIDVLFLEQRIPVHEGNFICNSSIDAQHDYQSIKKIMAQMALADLEKSELSILYYESLATMLIYHLRAGHFEKNLVPVPDLNEKNVDRMNEILMYIRKNYQGEMSLHQMAEDLHLSDSYLSRFIKKAFHENFVDYLKKFRLERSLHGILYTQMSITDIAMSCGFSNTSSYIHDFRKYYGQTPGNYRKQHNASRSQAADRPLADKKETVPLLTRLSGIENEGSDGVIDAQNSRHYVIDAQAQGNVVVPIWKTGIGIAAADNMTYHDISSEIDEVQRDIGFTYGRVSFLMSDMFMYDPENGNYNFFHFTRMIQDLKRYGLIPYLDINYNAAVIEESRNTYVIDPQKFLEYLEAMLMYSANVFGISELEQWIFDIGIPFNLNTQATENVQCFSRRFMGAYKLIKRIVPGAKVGGFDLCSVFMESHCEEILRLLSQNEIVPDFVSVNIFPYRSYKSNDDVKYVYTSEKDFPVNVVKKYKQIIGQCCQASQKRPLFFVSAIGTTIMHRNYMNDTCYQSSFIAQTILGLVGEVDLLCYYQLSDMNFSRHENQRLLRGRNGLISQFGIHKPGYLAFQMLSFLSDHLIARGEDYMVTKGAHHTYNILLYRPVKVSDDYCLRIDENTSLADAYTVYEAGESRSIFITLNHVRNGDYRIISYHINRENGSLFDEWEKTGFWENPGIHELNYLKQAIHPRRNCSQRSSFNGQLNFHINIQPFEVIMIEVGLVVD